MKCIICQLEFDKRDWKDEACSPECIAFRILTWALRDNGRPDEWADLQWEIRQRWHQVRGLPFKEPRPKPSVVAEIERQDLLDQIEGYPR